MSDELKAKLEEILQECGAYFYWEGTATDSDKTDFIEKYLPRIDQAYKEAGYAPNLQTTIAADDIQPVNLVEEYAGNGNFGAMLTGQEFCKRFEKEFEALIRQNDPGDAKYTLDDITYLDDFSANDILEAAKRAAGLQD